MSKDKPLISVIMGIYNCALTLSESIDSLLNQTYQDFELIMCDDGSTDDTYRIARQYADMHENIILLKNSKNMGLNYTLNHCLEYSQGEYIARQDGDDISLPNRFEEEIKFLENNPNIALVSCSQIHFNDKGDYKISKKMPYPQKKDFMYGTPFFHPCCIIRKSVLDDVGGYSVAKKLLRVEDYHLWFKIYSSGYTGYNIQEPLYKWRDDFDAYRRRNLRNRLNESYVLFIGIRMLKLPIYFYIFCIRPILVWLLPHFIYNFLRNKVKL
ncbi:putative glycosyltransferase EpsE [Spirochaetia bacterium]|nr:putative glycosyltransferase EpsE [Spirochaetia bacterium]